MGVEVTCQNDSERCDYSHGSFHCLTHKKVRRFTCGDRVEFDVDGTVIHAVVVNLQSYDEAEKISYWACTNVKSYGTCIVGENRLRESHWRMPWER